MSVRFLYRCAIILVFALGINPARAETLLVLGDSLAAGYGLEPGEALPARIEAALKEMGRDTRVVNGGVSGETSSGARTRLAWTVEAARPDAVIVITGGNDILRNLSLSVTEANLDAMLKDLSERKIPVVLAGIKPFGPAPDAARDKLAKRYEALFQTLARRHKTLLDPFILEGAAGKPGLMQNDGLHPSAMGADLIAKRLAPLAARLLDQ